MELRSIVQPLDLAELFRKPQPLEVELGCGDASFLVDYARCTRSAILSASSGCSGRIRKLDRKGRRAGLTNLRGVRIESSYFLEYLLPPHSVSALHVYFPDPWPKKRHHKNRLVNERFPKIARAALTPGGVVYLRTDDEDYFEQMTGVFEAGAEFQKIETPSELAELPTDFEREFHERGIRTLRAAYRSIRPDAQTSITGPLSSLDFGGGRRRERVTRVLPVPVKMFSAMETTLMMSAPRKAAPKLST